MLRVQVRKDAIRVYTYCTYSVVDGSKELKKASDMSTTVVAPSNAQCRLVDSTDPPPVPYVVQQDQKGPLAAGRI